MPCVNCTEDGGPLKTAAVPVPTLPMPDQEELDSKFSELVVSPKRNVKENWISMYYYVFQFHIIGLIYRKKADNKVNTQVVARRLL